MSIPTTQQEMQDRVLNNPFEDSLSAITITRQIPIINDFVQIPEALEKNKTRLPLDDVFDKSKHRLVSLEARTGGKRTAGGRHGVQEWLEVCDQPLDDSCDEAETIKDMLP